MTDAELNQYVVVNSDRVYEFHANVNRSSLEFISINLQDKLSERYQKLQGYGNSIWPELAYHWTKESRKINKGENDL
jgi:hypothetical protein